MQRLGTGIAIVVMGVSGSGKSTVGTRLAARLGVPYLDGDAFHLTSSIEKMRNGMALDDADRWPWLDRLANRINVEAATNPGVVASCSALKRSYRERLRAKIAGPIAYAHLIASQEALAGRLTHRREHYMPASLLTSQLQLLEPPDTDEIALTLTNEASVDEVVDTATRWVMDLTSGAARTDLSN